MRRLNRSAEFQGCQCVCAHIIEYLANFHKMDAEMCLLAVACSPLLDIVFFSYSLSCALVNGISLGTTAVVFLKTVKKKKKRNLNLHKDFCVSYEFLEPFIFFCKCSDGLYIEKAMNNVKWDLLYISAFADFQGPFVFVSCFTLSVSHFLF